MSSYDIVPPRAWNADERTNELSSESEWGVTDLILKTKGKHKTETIFAVSVMSTWYFRKGSKYWMYNFMGEKQHLHPEITYLYSVLSVNKFEMSLFEGLLQ